MNIYPCHNPLNHYQTIVLNVLSISKSTLILAEKKDDEYESFNELLRMSSL
jgi:hypothetical protein